MFVVACASPPSFECPLQPQLVVCASAGLQKCEGCVKLPCLEARADWDEDAQHLQEKHSCSCRLVGSVQIFPHAWEAYPGPATPVSVATCAYRCHITLIWTYNMIQPTCVGARLQCSDGENHPRPPRLLLPSLPTYQGSGSRCSVDSHAISA